MRYLNTEKKRSYRRELGVFFAVVFVFLLYAFLPGLIISGASLAGRLSSPFFNIFGGREKAADSWSLLFSQKKALMEENRKIAEQLSVFENKALLSDLLLSENQALKDFKEKGLGRSPLSAPVVARGGLSLYGTLTIGLGKKDGLKEGDLILSQSGYLLGRVARADEGASLVSLFSADGEKRDVFVGPKRLLLEAKGQGSGNFIIEGPHEAGIVAGDPVINALGEPYPLGVVEKIKYNPADPFETIRFQHPLNIRDIRFVLVVPSL